MVPLAQSALWLSSSNDDAKMVVYAALGFVFGIVLFVRGFRLLQRKRLILDTPSSHIRSAALGLVELNGLAVGPCTLNSPITMRPCFYYRTALWREVGSGKNRHWELAVDERFHVPFFLKDETGMVMVNPHGAEMDIHCDYTASYSTSMFSGDKVSPRVAEFAVANGIMLSTPLKVEEYCIKPHNALYVLGTLDTNPGLTCSPTPVPTIRPTQNVSGAAGTGVPGIAGSLMNLASLNLRSALQKPAPTFGAPVQPVALTDIDRKLAEARSGHHSAVPPEQMTDLDRKIAAFHAKEEAHEAAAKPHDGPLDPRVRPNPAAAALAATNPAVAAAMVTVAGGSLAQAFSMAAAAAKPAPAPADPATQSADAAAKPGSQGTQPAEEPLPDKSPTVICKGRNNPAFFISWRSQKDVVSDLSTRSTLFIFGGPALSAVCLWYLLWYFKAL